MKVASVEVEPYEVGLRRPLPAPGGPINRRRGFLLRLLGDGGAAGRGEAGPAYWLGDESLESVAATVDAMRSLRGSSAPLSDLEAWRRRSPAAACALETAWLDLEGRTIGRAVTELLGGAARDVEVSALIVAEDLEEIERMANDLVQRGYAAVKLKVGRRALDEDVRRVAAVRRACGEGVALRLDANRAWRLDHARRALVALAPFAPAFVEEPLASGEPAQWRRLRDDARAECAVPLAADESIESLSDLRAFAETGALDVVVLKAARLGGPTALLEMAREARRLGVAVVVTDAIETGVGRALAAHAAAALDGGAPEPVGLGGAVLMAADPHAAPAVEGARVRVGGPGLGI